MPFIKLWVHLIWSTKNRDSLISKELKPKLLAHIRENAKTKDAYIDTINCVSDHIHMLISFKGEQSVSKVVQLLKGESSFWVNKNKLSSYKFEWQDEFIAVSVSESAVASVREYINNQEEYHRVKSFKEEYDLFVKKYGFEKLKAKAV
jgi:putative transposase